MLVEVDTDSLDELKIICQRLSMDDDTRSDLLSQKSLKDVFNILLKHTGYDVRELILIMDQFFPKIIQDSPVFLSEILNVLLGIESF